MTYMSISPYYYHQSSSTTSVQDSEIGELEVQARGGSHCLMTAIDSVIYARKVAENEGVRRMPGTLEGDSAIYDNWLAQREERHGWSRGVGHKWRLTRLT